MHSRFLSVSAVIAGLLLSVRSVDVIGAAAQATADDSSIGLSEVVVTAQKRDTTVLKAPTTVEVLPSSTIQNFRINDLQSLNRLVPGFQFEYGSGGNMTLSVRGVGTTSSAQSFEQSVAPYIEGVYLGGNNRDFSWPLFDLNHIEVLKGTQSGIAGQNTSVGIVNVVTQKPGAQLGGYFTGGGEVINGGYNAEGAIDIPVADNFRMRVSGYYNDRGGWIHNVVTGHDLGEQATYASRLNAIWDASDHVSVRLFGEYDHERQIGSSTAIIYSDPTGGYAAYIAPYLTWRANIPTTASYGTNPVPGLGASFGGDSGVLADSFKGSLTIDADLGRGFTLTSITAGSFINDHLSVDQDFSPADVPTAAAPAQSQWLAQDSKYHQITQEIRLASPLSDPFSYIVGLWYRHANTHKTTDILIAPRPAVLTGISWPFEQVTNNASVFGDVNYKVNDKFTVGGTLRYTRENKNGAVQGLSVFSPNPTFPAFAPYESRLSPRFVDGSFRVQYEMAANANLYALYSHGTKTGALVDLVASGQPQTVKPEKVQTYEVGSKFELLDRTLDFNLSVFHMDITDYQDSFTAAVNGTVLFVASNSDVKSNGVDGQLQWRASRALTLGSSFEYLNAHNITFGGNFVRSPRWQVTGNARYAVPLFGLDTALFADFAYKDDYFNYPQGQAARFTAKTPAYTTADVGGEVNLTPRFKLSVLCKNCTNTYADIRATAGSFGPAKAPAVYAYIPELRTVTLQARYEF